MGSHAGLVARSIGEDTDDMQSLPMDDDFIGRLTDHGQVQPTNCRSLVGREGFTPLVLLGNNAHTRVPF